MRNLLIILSLSALLLSACTNKKDKIAGIWYIDKISITDEGQFKGVNVDEINKLYSGQKYEFRNDSTFFCDKHAGFYSETEEGFLLTTKKGDKDNYKCNITDGKLELISSSMSINLTREQQQ